MNRNSKGFKAVRRLTCAIGRANTGYIANISGVKPQTDYAPADPKKDRIRPLDDHPEAVRKREKAARNSLIVPLAVILGVAVFFIIVCLVCR